MDENSQEATEVETCDVISFQSNLSTEQRFEIRNHSRFETKRECMSLIINRKS